MTTINAPEHMTTSGNSMPTDPREQIRRDYRDAVATIAKCNSGLADEAKAAQVETVRHDTEVARGRKAVAELKARLAEAKTAKREAERWIPKGDPALNGDSG